MSNVFSPRTLEDFEKAAASIPLRQIDRAFISANIRLAEDPGGPEGARRVQFRRYVASVDQRDPQQRSRLGDVLGRLIDEVAESKKEFLVKAAERDGFSFADGVFRPAVTSPNSFAVTRVEDLALIDDRGRRLHLLANTNPADAAGGAAELLESVCRTVLNLVGQPAPATTIGLAAIAESTLTALEAGLPRNDDATRNAALVRRCLQQLGAAVATVGELRNVDGQWNAHDGKREGLSPRYARLAVGAAVAFAGFVAEPYTERAASKDSTDV